jgi:hypothetical protein
MWTFSTMGESQSAPPATTRAAVRCQAG